MRSFLLCFVILGVLALAGTAYGQAGALKEPTDERDISGNSPEAKAHLRDVERFLKTAQDVDGEINQFVRGEIQRRKAFINRSYDRLLYDVDLVQQERRIEAIEYFERFLRKYPSHRHHTPDALFRLAELYFEKAETDHQIAIDAFDAEMDAFDVGTLTEEPPEPELRYDDTIRAYQELYTRFPDYRYADAAMYLLGYVYEASGYFKKATESFETLVTQYPESDFVPESYLRIGEYWFDRYEWEKAVLSYQEAMTHTESRFYDKAIYKLAWTYFQKYDYDQAIRTFKELIAFYDDEGTADDVQSGELRAEAVTYLARSLTEDDWDGDGEADENAGVDRALGYLNDGKAYERDILKEYAKSLFELHETRRYMDAARVFERLIQMSPDDPENPAIQETVVAIYDLMGDREGVTRQMAKAVTLFRQDGHWYKENRANGKATAKADELVERTMRQQAQYYHQIAQQLQQRGQIEKNDNFLIQAAASYQSACESYAGYLASYPHSKDAYYMNYLFGEALYFSGKFARAASQYELVRDYPARTKYREQSGYSAINSLEKELTTQVGLNRLPKKVVPGQKGEPDEAESRGEENEDDGVRRVTPENVPPLVLRWIADVDVYVEADLNRSEDPAFQRKASYLVADMLYRFKNYDDSRSRFEEIIDRYPGTEVAGYAAAKIIGSYRAENDWDNIERWAQIITEKKIGPAEEQKRLQEEIQLVKLGAQFKRAERLFEAKRYLAAAKEFERVVDGDKKEQLKFADRALLNAALAYQEVHYYDSAARIFERIVVEPRFSESPFVEDALFQLAQNNKKFFNFEKSISSYLALVKRNLNHKQAYYSLYEAARQLEYQGDLKEAAAQYERYVQLFSQRSDVPGVHFHVGEIYDKMEDFERGATVYRKFVDLYKLTPSASEWVVEAYLKLAVHAKRRGKTKEALRLFRKVISEYQTRSFKPGSKPATYAARSQFELMEVKFQEFNDVQVVGSARQSGLALQKKSQLILPLQNGYEAVFPYKALEWTFASYLRIGNIYDYFAKAAFGAPIPESFSEEDKDAYRMELEDFALPYEDEAAKRYELTVVKAREFKFENKWTQRALERINEFKPREYPLLKEEKSRLHLTPTTDSVWDAQPGDGLVRPTVILEMPPVPVPEGSSPEGSVSTPEESAPEESAPEESAPEESAPEEPAPEEPAPEEPTEEGGPG